MKRTAYWGATLALLAGCSGNPSEPVLRIERGSFVHTVSVEGTLESRETTNISVPPTVRSRVRLAWVAPEGTLVEEGDLIARFDRKEFERRLEEAEADLASATLGGDEARAQSDRRVAEHQRDLGVAELELDFARRYQKQDDRIFSWHEMVESEIDEELAGVRRDHAEGMKTTQADLGRTELELLEIERRKANLRIDEARAGLESLEVRAPHGGILTLVRNWRGDPPTVGAEMWSGQEIAEIPSLTDLQALVYVLETDARGLEEGRPAEIVVEAWPESVHRGTIARIEALAKPHFRGSPVQYFGVEIELEQPDLARMKPGQRVSATLILDELEDAIVVPRQAVILEGEKSWVYRRAGSTFEPTEIRTGTSSAGLVVVDSGLAEGDVIALLQPLGAAPIEAEDQ